MPCCLDDVDLGDLGGLEVAGVSGAELEVPDILPLRRSAGFFLLAFC